VAEGDSISEIRFPNNVGIAGSVYTSGKSLNIPYAYADLRFNPSFDRQTGFFTRSILCVPIHNKDDVVIGVTQVLNKKGGCFTDDDENRLRAFTAQVSIALENSQLFDDVQRVKNYNESILKSMSNGVITLDASGTIVTCNAASLSVWAADEEKLVGCQMSSFLGDSEQWVLDSISQVQADAKAETYPDVEMSLGGVSKSINLTVMPLVSEDNDDKLGAMLMFEDISSGKRMMSTMSRYMDPVIASQMLEGDGIDRLGGTQAEATVMFTDVRGFTTITEEYGAQGTVSFLNDYFSLMVDCITNEGGMLDKFIGDAIMACFGLPVAHGDDPDRAVKASIKMIDDLWEWNEKRTEQGLKTVDMGIGLNTDSVVSGNIGSPKRMDYTVIGDGVNLAARLESACKSYSARILASESTVSQLKGTYRMRDIDLVIVKGKTTPVRVFELLDYHTEKTFPNLVDVINYFNEAVQEYRSGNWNKAISRFEQVLKQNPKDLLSETYIDRCKMLSESPPEEEWDGVWVMTSK
jgi:adenylate cyclase